MRYAVLSLLLLTACAQDGPIPPEILRAGYANCMAGCSGPKCEQRCECGIREMSKWGMRYYREIDAHKSADDFTDEQFNRIQGIKIQCELESLAEN